MHGDFFPRFVSARTAVHKLTVREKILSLPAMPTPSRNYKSRICKRSKTCNGFTMTWRFWHMNGVAKFGGRICFQVSSMNASCSLHSDHCLNVSKMHCWHCSNWRIKNVNWNGVTWGRLLNFLTPQLSMCMSRLIVLLVLPAPMAARSVEACHWSSLIPTFSCCAIAQHDSEILFLHEV